jgi:ankyrin repeat protein
MYAALELDLDLAFLLLQFNSSLQIKDSLGKTALFYAIYSYEKTERKERALDMITLFIRNNSPLNEIDYEGSSLLTYSVSRNLVQIVLTLLENGADVDIQNAHDGSTPLHIAVLNNKKELVMILLSYRANLNIKNRQGQTPIDLGTLYNHTEIYITLVEEFNKRNKEPSNKNIFSHAPVMSKLNAELSSSQNNPYQMDEMTRDEELRSSNSSSVNQSQVQFPTTSSLTRTGGQERQSKIFKIYFFNF